MTNSEQETTSEELVLQPSNQEKSSGKESESK